MFRFVSYRRGVCVRGSLPVLPVAAVVGVGRLVGRGFGGFALRFFGGESSGSVKWNREMEYEYRIPNTGTGTGNREQKRREEKRREQKRREQKRIEQKRTELNGREQNRTEHSMK